METRRLSSSSLRPIEALMNEARLLRQLLYWGLLLTIGFSLCNMHLELAPIQEAGERKHNTRAADVLPLSSSSEELKQYLIQESLTLTEKVKSSSQQMLLSLLHEAGKQQHEATALASPLSNSTAVKPVIPNTQQAIVDLRPSSPSKGNAKELLNESTDTAAKAVLLPPPMALWRRNISELHNSYSIPPRQFNQNCSCLNPKTRLNCCSRSLRLTHKMGYSMSVQLLQKHRPSQMKLSVAARTKSQSFPANLVDYRDVLLFRNIYDALKSGYLYHLTGRECWLDSNSRKITQERSRRHFWKVMNWLNIITLDVPMSVHQNRSLCQFLIEEDEKVGMRVYIDYVFHAYYNGSFAHLALAQAFPEVHERTRHACYEDILSPTQSKKAIEGLLSFMFNTTIKWSGKLPGKTKYVGGHGTSHTVDPDQSRRLLQIIRELDEEVFNNEIAWVDSVLPC